jgi:DNA-binding NtrC family response regulator
MGSLLNNFRVFGQSHGSVTVKPLDFLGIKLPGVSNELPCLCKDEILALSLLCMSATIGASQRFLGIETRRSVMDKPDTDSESFYADDHDSASTVLGMHPTVHATSKGKLAGHREKLVEVMKIIDRAARSDCNVLITSDSDIGKEMVVGALHDASPRRNAPLITVNCASLSESLLEGELFGHADGASAHATPHGRVDAAEGGTLFLDEVGELSLSLQVKLLRLLQERAYSPAGEESTVRCDVRVVAATHRDLANEAQGGHFLEDLFYRLTVIHVHLPPLREQREDVELLATYFLRTAAERSGRDDLIGFTQDALSLLKSYDWPGNVRALENAIARAVLFAPGPYLQMRDLAPRLKSVDTPPIPTNRTLPDEGIDLRAAVEEFESHLIRQALEKTGGNKNKAAQLLRLNRTTLVEMVKRKRLTIS